MISIQEANQIIKSQEQEYNRFEPLWKECQQYVNPFMGRFTNSGDTNTQAKHKPRYATEPSAAMYLRTMAAGLQAGTTSRTRPWFSIVTDDPEFNRWAPMARWIHETSTRMYQTIDQSNYYKAQQNGFLELGNFGTASKSIMPHPKGGIIARAFTCGEYMISLDEFGEPNVFSRKSWYTARQAVEEFGDRVSESIKTAYNGGSDRDKKFLICHLILPNYEAKEGMLDNLNMPWISHKWELGNDEGDWLSISGFRERPVQTPRWWSVSDDAYGVSPTMQLLGRVRLLHKLDQKSIMAIDKVVSPPTNAPTVAKNSKHSKSMPNSMFYTTNTREQAITPQYQINWDIQAAEFKLDRVKEELFNGYYNPLFTALLASQDDPSKSATEVIKIDEERLAQLGPVLEAIHYEDTGPGVQRIFQIMFDNGELPEPPAEMFQRKLKIEYSSVVAQAQKALNVTSTERLAGFVGNISAVVPSVLDNIDFDEQVRDYAEQLGTQPDQLRSEEDVEQIRAGRAAQEAQAQQAQLQNVNAQSAKILSETDTSREDSALNQVLGA